MIKRNRQLVTCAAVLMALMLAAAPRHAAQAQEPVKIRVETVDSGFRCAPEGPNCLGDQNGDFIIQVEQGQMVEVTFAWAHVGYVQEEHVVVLEGYKLETDKLTGEHREGTLKLIADKAGSFNFKCDLECDVHDYLQRGYLKVQRGGGGGAAALTPTTLTLSPSSWATAGDAITLTAFLKDPKGLPVPKAELRFFLATDFAGTKGQMEIAKARTDANGVAFVDFQPTIATRQVDITARFEGMGIYDQSQEAIQVLEAGTPPPAYRTALIGLESIRSRAILAFGLVMLTLWLTFGFVLFQALGISRARGRR